MKTYSQGLTNFGRKLGGLLGAVAVFLSAKDVSMAAPSADPSNGGALTWDCVMNGKHERGIAFLTFFSDSTFAGYEILVAKNTGTNDTSGDRTVGDSGRDLGSGGNGGTNLFGFASIDNGVWAIDLEGRIVGSYFRDTPDGLQGVSFVGKATSLVGARPRLSLRASTVQGIVHYRGVLPEPLFSPVLAPAPDVSGSWIGNKNENGLSLLEFFTLTPDALNLYSMDGTGPGYSYSGACMVSVQRKIAFAAFEQPDDDTNLVIRATMGTLRNSKGIIRAKTSGNKEFDLNIRFDAEFLGSSPE